jgi:hypothetical protein
MSSALTDVDDVVRWHGYAIWRVTEPQRRRLLHGGHKTDCPYPAGPVSGRALCAACTELWHEVVMIAAPKLVRALQRERPVRDVDAYVATTARNAVRDARDRWDAEHGLLVRPATRLPERAWVARVCRDPEEVRLLIRMLLAVREPRVEATDVLPVERWADQDGIAVATMRRKVEELIDRWEALEPQRFTANLAAPISRRLAGHVVAVDEPGQDPIDSELDDWRPDLRLVA